MKNRTRVVAVALAILVVAAGPAGAQGDPVWPCAVTVSIAPGPMHDLAVGALGELNAVSATDFVLVDFGGTVDVQWRRPEGARGTTTTWATATRKVKAIVEVDPSTAESWRKYVILHEFGHVGGLRHSQNPDAVMGPHGPVAWTAYGEEDEARLSAVRCHG